MGKVSKYWLAHPYYIYPQVIPRPPRSSLKRQNLLPKGAIREQFFLFTVDIFSKGTWRAGKQTGSHKKLSPVKAVAKNIWSVSSSFNPQRLSSALSACDFKSHFCKQCGPRSDCSSRSSLICVYIVCLYAKSVFEKFAGRCSRRHKQRTF